MNYPLIAPPIELRRVLYNAGSKGYSEDTLNFKSKTIWSMNLLLISIHSLTFLSNSIVMTRLIMAINKKIRQFMNLQVCSRRLFQLLICFLSHSNIQPTPRYRQVHQLAVPIRETGATAMETSRR